MNCIDCNDPAVAGERRCAECLEEVRESPNWRQGPRATASSASPPPAGKACPACLRPLRLGWRGKWCSEACRRWAGDHPGEVRIDPNCRGCGRQFRPPGADTWCADCRSVPLICEQCGRPTAWRLGQDRQPIRFCSRACVGAFQTAIRAATRPECSEAGCDKPSRCNGRCKGHYTNWYYGPEGPGDPKSRSGDPEKRKARERAKTHLRKAVGRYTDITPEDERRLRDRAKRCPYVKADGSVCAVKLVKDPYQPASKELDHIVPINMGGTHTHGNVRIICRDCNLRRPKDGSDYSGPVTLWAQAG